MANFGAGLGYRPQEEDIKRKTEELAADAIKEMASKAKGNINIRRQPDKDISEMSRGERNDYLLEYNTNKIPNNLSNTVRALDILIAQSLDVEDRAKEVADYLQDTLPDISTENAPDSLKETSMPLLFGDVDTRVITPAQLRCASKCTNMQQEFIKQSNKGIVKDITEEALGNPVGAAAAVPQNQKEFEETMRNTFNEKNLFKWNIFTFLIMLLKIVLETVILFIFKPICKITIKIIGIKLEVGKWIAEGIKVKWKAKQIGSIRFWYLAGGLPGPITILSMTLLSDPPLTCNSMVDLDLKLFVKDRWENYHRQRQRGSYASFDDFVDENNPDPNDPQIVGPAEIGPFCPDGDRMPTVDELAAADEILKYTVDQVKDQENAKVTNNVLGFLAAASAEEEVVPLRMGIGNTRDKMQLAITAGGDSGISGKPSFKVTTKQAEAPNNALVKLVGHLTETLRNVDMTVSSALELKHLGERWKDTICCFIRILYAIFVGSDDFALGEQIEQSGGNWDSFAEKSKKVANKLKLLSEVADTILSIFTTTIGDAAFTTEIGNFHVPGFKKFIIKLMKRALFESLVAVSEFIFSEIRVLLFDALDEITLNTSLGNALKECVLWDMLMKWMTCLLNFIENKIYELLLKLREEGDFTWGSIEIGLDFAFQNTQITFLRDLLRLIGKWALKIVTICNVNNIKDNDKFQELVKDIHDELKVEAYNEYDKEEPEYFAKGISQNMATSVMRPGDDHSGLLNSKQRNFLNKTKGGFGFNWRENIIVDQGGETSDNIPTTASGVTPEAEQQRKSRLAGNKGLAATTVVPPTLAIPKGDFVEQCTRTYTNTGDLIRNNKKLVDIFKRYKIYDVFDF